jgi:hypothetical protein
MRFTRFAALAPLLLLPIEVQAQQWSAEQQEVWRALEACWSAKTIDTAMACIHDDYVSFQTAEGVPQNKVDLRATWAHGLETQEPLWVYRRNHRQVQLDRGLCERRRSLEGADGSRFQGWGRLRQTSRCESGRTTIARAPKMTSRVRVARSNRCLELSGWARSVSLTRVVGS